VSPTRLCVRNIPVSVTDSRLKKTFIAAAGNQKAKVTEVCYLQIMINVFMLLFSPYYYFHCVVFFNC